jgi:hypothetical protein
MKTSSKLLTGIAAMAVSIYAQAYPGESIVLDQATGNYTITYRGDPNSTELSQTVFVPSTKVVPAIHSSFRLVGKGIIVYRYTVSNSTTAKQAIVGVVLDQIVNPIVGELPFPSVLQNATPAENAAYDAAEKAALSTPTGWDGGINRFQGEYPDRVFWMPKGTLKTGGVQAGHTLTGFGFSSVDLPGVWPSQMDGIGEVLSFSDEGPVEDSAILTELNRLRDNDFVTRPAAVPMIAVPAPFDAAALLGSLQTQMHTWITMNLLDATFSAQLDRYFQSAISAYRLNQPGVGKQQIEAMRELIGKEHPDMDRDEEHESDKYHEKNDDRQAPLIDKLAARVLDFDLGYVTRRMEEDTHQRDAHERDAHKQDEGKHKPASQIER